MAMVHCIILPAVCKTYLLTRASAYALAVKAAKIGLKATLFLIGTGISMGAIQRVGHRPLLQGIVLWLIGLTLSLCWFAWGGLDYEKVASIGAQSVQSNRLLG
jgi:uncharacterized membrane protein YadS